MNIQEELINSIKTMIDKKFEGYLNNKEIASVVTEISKNKYKVNINGKDYWLKDGVNINPTVGTAVWVRTPNGNNNMNDAYICARR